MSVAAGGHRSEEVEKRRDTLRAAVADVVAAACLLIDSDKPVTVLIIPRYISFTTKRLRNLSTISNHITINNVFAKSYKNLNTGG